MVRVDVDRARALPLAQLVKILERILVHLHGGHETFSGSGSLPDVRTRLSNIGDVQTNTAAASGQLSGTRERTSDALGVVVNTEEEAVVYMNSASDVGMSVRNLEVVNRLRTPLCVGHNLVARATVDPLSVALAISCGNLLVVPANLNEEGIVSLIAAGDSDNSRLMTRVGDVVPHVREDTDRMKDIPNVSHERTVGKIHSIAVCAHAAISTEHANRKSSTELDRRSEHKRGDALLVESVTKQFLEHCADNTRPCGHVRGAVLVDIGYRLNSENVSDKFGSSGDSVRISRVESVSKSLQLLAGIVNIPFREEQSDQVPELVAHVNAGGNWLPTQVKIVSLLLVVLPIEGRAVILSFMLYDIAPHGEGIVLCVNRINAEV